MTAKLIEIECSIEGITPLLINRFGDQAAMDATAGSRGSSAAADKGTPLEQSQGKLYVSAQKGNALVIPQPNIFASMMGGGEFFKIGKKQVTTKKTSMLPACVDMDDIEYPIEHKEPWTVDTRAVRIPSTGGRILCHRPCFHDWRLSFVMTLDAEILGMKLLRQVIDAAGKRIGLGDFRPQCKGPFGKYVVVKWAAQELSEKLAA